MCEILPHPRRPTKNMYPLSSQALQQPARHKGLVEESPDLNPDATIRASTCGRCRATTHEHSSIFNLPWGTGRGTPSPCLRAANPAQARHIAPTAGATGSNACAGSASTCRASYQQPPSKRHRCHQPKWNSHGLTTWTS